MASRRLTLEALPDSLLVKILEYLSIYECYSSLFSLNRRYAQLVKRITPDHVDPTRLNEDVDRSGVLISDYWVWNDTFVYWMVPQLRPDGVRWSFLTSDSIDRVHEVLARYPVRSNAPGLLVSRPNYYFCSIPDDLPRLEEWIRENYPAQYEVIRQYGTRQHLPRRIEHHDGRHAEIKQALDEVQRLERLKRKSMIHQSAQLVWVALKADGSCNLLHLENAADDEME